MSVSTRRFAWVQFLIAAFVLSCLLVPPAALAQSETATVSGRVVDQSGAIIVGAEVEVKNVETNIGTVRTTNRDGLYAIPSLHPGHYLLTVRKPGFKTVTATDLTLNVQDNVARNVQMQVGSATESVTVSAEAATINTTDATVSTVIDRNFAENLPLNGRSFQTLIALTPGVVVTSASGTDPGQFSVNGQRSSANYLTVDGVSANIGVSPTPGLFQTAAGASQGFGITGGTNNLVSEDALQEFRILTSTYAPEFGRTPGAQISVATRSGTNQFHGALFEYLRNDALDANDWFSNHNALPKSKERINDFGGVVGGPIQKDRTFFFFSYEGQRLRLPQTAETLVPSINARQLAPAEIQPFLNAYPLPNGPEILDPIGNPTGAAPFNQGFSNQSTLNATSLRLDHTVNDRLMLFGRYDYAPSDALQRGGAASSLNALFSTAITTQTLTLGSTWSIRTDLSNEFRFNYSRSKGTGSATLDTFGGAIVPDPTILYPAGVSTASASYDFDVFGLGQNSQWNTGKLATNVQKQFNVVDSVWLQKGAHALKFGLDYRRLSPDFGPVNPSYFVGFPDVPSVSSGTALEAIITSNQSASVVFHNLGLFAQDTWRVAPRISLTYGLRWDLDFAPSSLHGPELAGVTGFNDPANLAIAPGTPVFSTKYGNVAPRIGIAYELNQAANWNTVLRGGFGIFYDLATTEIGTALVNGNFPFGASKFVFFTPFPLQPAVAAPPSIALPTSRFTAFDPDLELPRTYQWNVTVEQSLGKSQSISIGDIGAVGRRLIQAEGVFGPNPNFGVAALEKNTATSDYHALQIQFRRQMSKGLQALASYTWSHSIDSGSSGSFGSESNQTDSSLGANINRGPSDFDIRHQFSAALAYDVPVPPIKNAFLRYTLSHWSLDNIIQARSAPPVDVINSNFFFGSSGIAVRPDLTGQPLYLSGTQYPGGRAINFDAFDSNPLTDPITGSVLRQGDLGRNALRGFPAAQWDLGIRREFPIRESVRLQFRAELFNILNHPNFANPVSDLAFGPELFGQSNQILARGLGGNEPGGGGFASIFQLGGPRSVQFALKLMF